MLEPQDRRNFLKRTTGAAVSAAVIGAASDGKAAEKSMNNDFFAKALECLGGPWPAERDLRPQVLRTEQQEGYRRIRLDYEVEPGDRVPAILLLPDGVSQQSPAPAVAVWHQHNGEYHLGKSEPAGIAGNPMHHTGVALAKLGYVVLCPDALCFEDRQDPEGKLKEGNFERFEFLRYVVDGKCMAWKNILDMRRGIDYLQSIPEVKPDRIGCYGHSMGSTHAWLVGPFEPRLKAVVGNCCLPTYAGIHRTKILHCFPNFVPGLQRHGDTPDLVALIAPRALHLNLGELDTSSPLQEVKLGIERIAAAYRDAPVPENFTYFIEPDAGHVLSEAMWRKVRDVFQRHLQG